MKENMLFTFAMKHPFITFLIADSAIAGVQRIVYILKTGKHPNCEVTIHQNNSTDNQNAEGTVE